ncbi:hypothetical protein [Heyndrickxia camelliae]|uniref:Uncharacterized protein n=1 Tax=Heyndrickxia camelliae TaxID=1707093 RepID=A0A2N3LCW0_9BACI|nr:hypothetical protein [Heyndrickxia camelliae]PKR82405.1 hypothetical protein CWO92_24625 [Heyndrickxia camelliae]
MIKCKVCNQPLKETDDIMVVDGNIYEAVHDECHYRYISNMHMNNLVSLGELKEMINEYEETL